MSRLPAGWSTVTLAKVTTAPKKVDPVTTGRQTVRYLEISGIDGDRHVVTSADPVESATAPARCRQPIRSGDTVFSTVRPYLEHIAYIDDALDDEFASTGFCVLRPTADLDPRYLFHFASSPLLLDQVLPLQKGVSYPAVLDKEVRGATILVPPIDEQRRIVAILEDHLSRLDAAAASLAAASRRAELFRLSALARLAPEDALSVKLGDLALDSGYGTSTKCTVDGPGVPVARIPNVVAGRIDMTDEKRALDPAVDLGQLMLAPGDLLIVRTNGSKDLIGRSAVVQEGINASFASYLIRYRIDPARALPEWVQSILDRPQTRHVLESLAASSAGQHNLSLGKLDGVAIPLPSVAHQRRLIAEFTEAQDSATRAVRAIEQQVTRGEALRRSLLGAAFRGDLTAVGSVV